MRFSVQMLIDAPDATDLQTADGIAKYVKHYMGASGCHMENITVIPQDLKIEALVDSGEMELSQGDGIPDILQHAGGHLDSACAWDILGNVVFVGSDGKIYAVNVEAEIGHLNPELLRQYAENVWDASEENAVYVMASAEVNQGSYPDTGYGYEIAGGENHALVRIGGYSHEEPQYVVVPKDRVFHLEDLDRLPDGFVWDHPDKGDWDR